MPFVAYRRRRRLGRLVVAMSVSAVVAQASHADTIAEPPVAPPVVTRYSGKHLDADTLPPLKRFVTQHRITIRGVPVAYQAIAEQSYVTNMEGEPTGRFFSFSYLRSGPFDINRPVLFIFNGGPGSASCWLHMGALGPKRVILDKNVNPSSVPPFSIVDNGASPLDVADLVFIDPIGTGFSHAVGEAKDTDFAGVDADADSVARFIESWLTRYGRFRSPKFVLGESYGGYRASVLPRALMGGLNNAGVMRGITLNGVIIVGSPIGNGADPSTIEPKSVTNSSGAMIPSMAVTASYHKRLPSAGRSIPSLYLGAENFARGPYLDALRREKSGQLSDEERENIANRLAELTAVSADVWLKNKLEIGPQVYQRAALAGTGLDVGLYDTRYTLPDRHNGGDFVADDPAMAQYVPGIIAAFQDVLRNDLKVSMPIPYEAIVWDGVFDHWDFRRTGVPPTQTYAGDLAVAMRRQSRMRLMLMSGYYDLLATPMAMRVAAEEAGLPSDRLTFKTLESGHMSYLGGTSAQFADDVRQFILASLPRGSGLMEARSSHRQ